MRKLSILFLLAALPIEFLGAQAIPPTPTPLPTVDLVTALTHVVNLAFWIILIAALFTFIYGGYSYITSGGDPAKAEKAFKMITYAIVGIIVAILAYGLREFIKKQIAG